ncbi:MAG: carbon-nitrogen hydrolase family protein, partial [Anaerolineales bacterium]
MKIALAQLSFTDNMEANLQKALTSMESAALLGAEAICFPEVQLSPFFPQYPGLDASKYAIPIDHQFIKILQ